MIRQPISASVRFMVFRRDGFACRYCGNAAPDVKLHIDHIMPVSRGGSNHPDNLRTACQRCNLGKSDKPLGTDIIAQRAYLQDVGRKAVEEYFSAIDAAAHRLRQEVEAAKGGPIMEVHAFVIRSCVQEWGAVVVGEVIERLTEGLEYYPEDWSQALTELPHDCVDRWVSAGFPEPEFA